MSVNHKEWRVVKVLQYQHCYLLKAKIVLLPTEFNVFNMFSSSKRHWNKLHSEKICETSCGKVAYSVVSVCLSTGKGSIVTITNDAMDLTTTQSARHVISLHGDAPPPAADIWWLVKHVGLASGRYPSYWNAFLRKLFSCEHLYSKPEAQQPSKTVMLSL